MGTNILPSSDVSTGLSTTGNPHAAQVNDGSDATYCCRTGSGSASDQLGVPANSPIPFGAIINQVLLKFRYKSENGYYGACAGRPWVKIDSNTTYGTSRGNNVSTNTFSDDITNSRPGGGSWVWSDFSSIRLGYTLTGDYWWDGDEKDPTYIYYKAYCYEVYLEVFWTTIEESHNSYSFEEVIPNSEYPTGLTYFTVKNNSDFSIDVQISGTDMTGGTTWTLADDGNPGSNIVAIKAGLEGGDYTITVKKNTPYNDLKASLGAGNSQQWGFKLYTPTNNPFSDTEAKTGYITLTAIAS